MKRALAILLCTVLLLTALPTAAFAAPQELSGTDALKQQISNIYERSQEDAGVESFQGLCGLMTSYQLYEMGINTNLAQVCDGNKQFDTYAAMTQTTGGYHITAYSSKDYTLEEALNEITRNGTQDVQNILIGFEATNTDAGGTYGHACVIHAIRDGVAYFVENYYTYAAGEEGNVIALTIAELVNFYKDWTLFDGVIHFGDRTYADSCQTFTTDLFVRSRFATTLRSEPSLLTENECVSLRDVAAGELLHATAVMMNSRGEYYYRVDDGLQTGYVAVNAAGLVRLNDEALTPIDIKIAKADDADRKITVSGTVLAKNSSISAVGIAIKDAQGEMLHKVSLDVVGCSSKLQTLNDQLSMVELDVGTYEVFVTATAACVAVKGTGLVTQYVDQEVFSQTVTITEQGQDTADAASEATGKRTVHTVENGWFWANGTMYYYENGAPCTGWMYHLGVIYYLNEDGAVTTGLAQVEGQLRYFSGTGAMYKGWLVTKQGLRYWDKEGNPATFWQEIDGARYYFGSDGLLVTQGIVLDGDEEYRLQEDGKAELIVPEETQ